LKRLIWILLSSWSVLALAQTSTVTVNTTDSAGQTWNNGTVSYVFVPNPIYGGQTPQFNGSALASNYLVPTVVTLSSSGTGSISGLPRTDYITPIGGQWKFVICPQFTALCGTLISPITGATVNLSAAITATINPPIITGFGSNSVAYSSSEVVAYTGALYYDLTAGCEKIYLASTWTCMTATGAQVAAAISGQAIAPGAVTPSGSIVPSVGNTYNLGSGAAAWNVEWVLNLVVYQALSVGNVTTSGTVVASSNCGSLAGAAGCLAIQVSGTNHYIPYY
jgi:hypothetical protein